jgi:hypothetical protein
VFVSTRDAPSKAAELLKRSVLGDPGDDVGVTVAASAVHSSAARATTTETRIPA